MSFSSMLPLLEREVAVSLYPSFELFNQFKDLHENPHEHYAT